MQVKSDKLWQEQVSSLRSTLDEESADIYLEIIEEVARVAEDELLQYEADEAGNYYADDVVVSVREGFKRVFREKGFLIPEALSDVLVVLILHWAHGEGLRDGLSPMEFSLVAESMANYLEARMEEAAGRG